MNTFILLKFVSIKTTKYVKTYSRVTLGTNKCDKMQKNKDQH